MRWEDSLTLLKRLFENLMELWTWKLSHPFVVCSNWNPFTSCCQLMKRWLSPENFINSDSRLLFQQLKHSEIAKPHILVAIIMFSFYELKRHFYVYCTTHTSTGVSVCNFMWPFEFMEISCCVVRALNFTWNALSTAEFKHTRGIIIKFIILFNYSSLPLSRSWFTSTSSVSQSHFAPTNVLCCVIIMRVAVSAALSCCWMAK